MIMIAEKNIMYFRIDFLQHFGNFGLIPIHYTRSKLKGVARGKSGWGRFPKGRRPRAGCGAEAQVAAQAKIFFGCFLDMKEFFNNSM